ncbi:MAG: ATP-binding protein, partial [Deltaproteobacteria bacterium]|nr:ATP-binding protein [Candidatus Tharpella sp.]
EISQAVTIESYNLKTILSAHERIVYDIIATLREKKILMFFERFLSEGVYPFYFEDKTKYLDRIVETLNTILHTDLGQLFNIQADKISTLKKLLLTICVSKPLELSIDKLALRVGITKSTLYKYIEYLAKAELVLHISHEAKRFHSVRKPDKLYLANTNLFNALCIKNEKGTLREAFFASMVCPDHSLYYLNKGDFLVDEKYVVEIGGRNKGFSQIKDVPESFVVADGIEVGSGNKIPLWLFGFLY